MTQPPPLSVLFDLDGTLVDSLQDLADTTNQILASRGVTPHPVEAYKTLLGDGLHTLIQRSLPEGMADDSALVEEMIQAMKTAYQEAWKQNTHPYDGIKEVLITLQKQDIRLGVFSNKPDAFTREIVRTLFPDIRFAAVRGSREGIPVKPDPTGAFQICEAWKTTPERVIYVGDTNTDMRTGRAAGFHTVGVTWGFRERQELEATGAHVIIDTPAELLRVTGDFPRSFID